MCFFGLCVGLIGKSGIGNLHLAVFCHLANNFAISNFSRAQAMLNFAHFGH